VDTVLAGKHYQIVASLGRGAMGEVYIVVHSILKRRFALKVIHPRYADDARVIDRMRIEAQATARLRHKNIVEVVDFWVTTDGRPCIVMELLQGATVAHEVLVNGPFRAAEAVEYTLQLLSALLAAHDLGVVHRDIKPENLFLHQQPERPRILKVLDFGFARVLPGVSARTPVPAAQPTATGTVVGSPRFASPEALRGERVDNRADLFAVGAVLYFMLTRRGPYDRMMTIDDPNAFDLMPPSAIRGPDVAPELDTIVLKATRWRPEERYQTASEFASELLSLRSSSPPAAP
jgi:serine/threonine-protein kinase